MPTTLPERAAMSRAQDVWYDFPASMTLIVILAAVLAVLALDRYGFWFATDCQSLFAYPIAGQIYFP